MCGGADRDCWAEVSEVIMSQTTMRRDNHNGISPESSLRDTFGRLRLRVTLHQRQSLSLPDTGIFLYLISRFSAYIPQKCR